MKLVLLADIHGDIVCIEETAEDIKEADVLIIAGDITAKGQRDEAEQILNAAEKFNKNILAVHGNMDYDDVRLVLEERNYSLHGNGRMFKGVGFFGVGGAIASPIRTRSNYEEHEIAEILETGYNIIQKAKTKVLVSHIPPKGTCDKTRILLHGGSVAVRDFIQSHEDVELCLCGHVHEAHGVGFLNNSRVVNAGSVKAGRYARIEIQRRRIMISERKLV